MGSSFLSISWSVPAACRLPDCFLSHTLTEKINLLLSPQSTLSSDTQSTRHTIMLSFALFLTFTTCLGELKGWETGSDLFHFTSVCILPQFAGESNKTSVLISARHGTMSRNTDQRPSRQGTGSLLRTRSSGPCRLRNAPSRLTTRSAHIYTTTTDN